jgi:phage shock protein PspC (stress-responsive transcriptional regulator)
MTTTPDTTTSRRLVRRSDDRMVAGVCSGVADYVGVDPTIVRLAVVVGTVLGFGTLLVAYVLAWLLMPEA